MLQLTHRLVIFKFDFDVTNIDHIRNKWSIVIGIVPWPRDTSLIIVSEIPNKTFYIGSFDLLQEDMIVFFSHPKLSLVVLLLIISLETFDSLILLSHLFHMGPYRISINFLFDILLYLNLSDLTLSQHLDLLIDFSFD